MMGNGQWTMGIARIAYFAVVAPAVGCTFCYFAEPHRHLSECRRERRPGIVLAEYALMRDWLDSLERRTKDFAIRVINLSKLLDRLDVPKSVIWQLVDSATSVAANHRACRRARSTRELIAKLGLVVEEADESNLWLELVEAIVLQESALEQCSSLKRETAELTAIFAKGVATTRQRLKSSNH